MYFNLYLNIFQLLMVLDDIVLFTFKLLIIILEQFNVHMEHYLIFIKRYNKFLSK